MIDLHTHSNYSDGLYEPAQVIENAVRDGLSAVALCDHDCTWGLEEAKQRAKELNIDFIPGIELTVSTENDPDHADEIHMLSVLVLVMSTPALSATCANGAGTQVIGVDGETYCRSNVSLNWWSAHAWCDAANMTLVSLDRCNGKNGNITGDTACPNFKGTGSNDCWTSSVPSSSHVFAVNLSSGAVSYYATRNYNSYALCE